MSEPFSFSNQNLGLWPSGRTSFPGWLGARAGERPATWGAWEWLLQQRRGLCGNGEPPQSLVLDKERRAPGLGFRS